MNKLERMILKIENLGNDPEIISLMKANDELRSEKKQLSAS